MNKKKITLKELIARKDAIIEGKKNKKTAHLFVKSLDGVITIQALEKSIVMEAAEMDGAQGDIYAVYQAVIEPNIKDKELRDSFGCVEPFEIVDKLFEPGEISRIAQEALKLSGYEKESVGLVEELKN